MLVRALQIWLCPTRLAVTMAGGAGGGSTAADAGFIIVETNYRVSISLCSHCRQMELSAWTSQTAWSA